MGFNVRCRSICVFANDGGIIGATRTSIMDPAIATRGPGEFLYGRFFLDGGFKDDQAAILDNLFGLYGGDVDDVNVLYAIIVNDGVDINDDLGFDEYLVEFDRFFGLYDWTIAWDLLTRVRAGTIFDVIFGR